MCTRAGWQGRTADADVDHQGACRCSWLLRECGRCRPRSIRSRRSEEEAVLPNPVYLEPQARAVADANANPPYLFELGPDQGRRTVDAVQSGPVKKLLVDIEDTAVPGGPSGQVSVCVVRPPGARRPRPGIVYLHGAGGVLGNNHTHDTNAARGAITLATDTLRTVVATTTEPPASRSLPTVGQSWTSQSASLARPRTSRAGWSCWLVGRVLGA
jgi:hypothetical protein